MTNRTRRTLCDAAATYKAGVLGDGRCTAPSLTRRRSGGRSASTRGVRGSAPKVHSRTLGHHGVLFLDELTEFRRDAVEGARQPLEDARVVSHGRLRCAAMVVAVAVDVIRFGVGSSHGPRSASLAHLEAPDER